MFIFYLATQQFYSNTPGKQACDHQPPFITCLLMKVTILHCYSYIKSLIYSNSIIIIIFLTLESAAFVLNYSTT